MSNGERDVKVVIDRKKGTMTVTLPIENRISGSEKSIIVAGIQGSMKIMVGKVVHTLACSLYHKNADYDAVKAAERREATKDENKAVVEDCAKVVAA